MNSSEIIFFSSFIFFVLGMLAIDLGVFNKESHVIGVKEALTWSIVWISISLIFYVVMIFHGDWIHGPESVADITALAQKYGHPILEQVQQNAGNFEATLSIYRQNLALEFLSGYLIEKALSVDNIFVIIMIFYAFGVDEKYYHHILFWGIIGAIVMRFVFIFLSAALIQEFGWILYLFGALLVFTGVKMFFAKDEEDEIEPHKHPIVKFASKYFSVFPRNMGGKFFVVKNAKFYITPLFVVLLVVEFSDVLFAVDSIPAIFAITKDPFIVFFSNIFAILGLRALFFLLINVINKFHYLKTGLSVLLTVIGLKMIFHHYLEMIHFTTVHSLILIVGILGISIVASLIFPKKEA